MSYPASVETFEDAVRVARRIIDHQTKAVASDAIVLARWIIAEEERQEALAKTRTTQALSVFLGVR
jgi:hypothetical protein